MNLRFWTKKKPTHVDPEDNDRARVFADDFARQCLEWLKAANESYPNGTQGQRYALACSRLGYTEEEFISIGRDAAIACRDSGIEFNFQTLISVMVVSQYLRRFGLSDRGLIPVATMTQAVREAIPPDL